MAISYLPGNHIGNTRYLRWNTVNTEFSMQFLSLVLCTAPCWALSAHQETLNALWETHLKHEFHPDHKSTSDTMATMVAEPYVNHIPTMVGGVGKTFLAQFYQEHFIFSNPPMAISPISRTIGDSSIVDEMIIEFNHTQRVDWMVPNVAPTGKRVRIPLVAIVQFKHENDEWKVAHEHIYWDQASVLAQLGLLDTSTLDVTGAEQADKVQDPRSRPSNLLLERREKKAEL
eukprot:g68316.t1